MPGCSVSGYGNAGSHLMAGLWKLSTRPFFCAVLRSDPIVGQRDDLRHFANASENLKSVNLYNPSKGQLRKSEKLFEVLGPKSVLQGSAVKIDDAPKLQLPEIAFIGRTSVGKSSLINALLHQRKLVRTSKKPGHTKLINFFNADSKFYLVDLPGYGYVQGQGQGSKHFVQVAEHYLKQRRGKQLKNVCLLVDAKVGLKRNDLIALEMLEEFGSPFQVVCTKMDRLPKDLIPLTLHNIQDVIERHTTICFPHVFAVSAKEKNGLPELRHFIALSTGMKGVKGDNYPP